MQERHEQQAAARIEFERERAMVDAVMQAIEEEDRLQGELKRQKAAETMKYIHDFIADRDALRQQQRQAEFEEEKKIQVFFCLPLLSWDLPQPPKAATVIACAWLHFH